MAKSFPARLNDVGAAVNSLANQPWLTAPSSKKVLFALAGNGATPRFVGGCVRDGLLGNPSKDLDIAIDQVPDDNMRLLQAVGVEVVPTGLKHGTITAISHDQPFEITTLRVDAESFGRHAKVAFTDDWISDAMRRDFTINALSADPSGKVYDYNGGIADLKHGKVRFIGNAQDRIDEDYLRILRFFRFQGGYGLPPLDDDAMAACRTGEYGALARGFQQAVHDARDDHGLPGRNAHPAWCCKLLRPIADRGTRPGVPETECLRLLALPLRWTPSLLQLLRRTGPLRDGIGSGRGVVRLCALD